MVHHPPTFSGDLKKIKIEHDNSGIRPGWMLDHVEIRNLATDRNVDVPVRQLARQKQRR